MTSHKLPLLLNSPLRPWFVLVGVSLAVFAVAFNTTSLTNAIGSIRDEMNLLPSQLTWIFNAYMLACLTLIITGGQTGDMYGRRKMLIFGCINFMLSSILIASSQNFSTFLIGRIWQGFSAAFIVPGAMSVIKVAFQGKSFSIAMGIYTAFLALGMAIGPISSGILIEILNWRWILWLNLPILCFSILFLVLFTKTSRGDTQHVKMDLLGLLFLCLALVPLNLGLIQSNEWGFTSPYTFIPIIVGGLLLIAFWAFEKKVKHPLIDFSHFKEKQFFISVICAASTGYIMLALLYFTNLYMQNLITFDYSALHAGFALLPLSLGLFVTSVTRGVITNHFGIRKTIIVAFALLIFALFWLGTIHYPSSYMYIAVPLAVSGFSLGLLFSTFPELALNALPDDKIGEGSGIINVCLYFSYTLSLAIGSIFYFQLSHRELEHFFKSLHISYVQDQTILQAISGHSSTLNSLINRIAPEQVASVREALGMTTTWGLTYVMHLLLILALIAMFLFLRLKIKNT